MAYVTVHEIIYMVGLSIIFVVGIIGNSLVIYIFNFGRNAAKPKGGHLSVMELLLSYLAFVDLVASISCPVLYISLIVTVYSWNFGTSGCILSHGVVAVSVTMSFGMILLITTERCIAFSFPTLKRLSRRGVHLATIVVFIIAVLSDLHYLKSLEYVQLSKIDLVCKETKVIESKAGRVKSTVIPIQLKSEHHNSSKFSSKSFRESDYVCILHSYQNLSLELDNSCRNFNDELKQEILSDIQLQSPFVSKPNNVSECIKKSEFHSNQSFYCNSTCSIMHGFCNINPGQEFPHLVLVKLIIRDLGSIFIFTLSSYFIYRTINKNKRALKGQSRLKAKKVFKLLITIAVIFLILVLPKDILVIVITLKTKIYKNGNISSNYIIPLDLYLGLFQLANNICNVFIYARLHKRFRKHLLNRLKKITKPKHQGPSEACKSEPSGTKETEFQRMQHR